MIITKNNGEQMKIELITVTPNAEDVIENAGRTCYQSDEKEGNSNGKLIKKLICSGHDSVLEHASATFRINGVSRAMTHQLVRHRIASYSQQSQRYVREDQFEYVVPPAIIKLDESDIIYWALETFKKDMATIQSMYDKWKKLGLRNEDARFVLPNACCSEIVMSANFREWRKIFQLRCSKHAQWEIREAMTHCLMHLNKAAPNTFADLAEQYLVKPE
jgi:thymidylate synthase (FAD)